MLTYRKAIAFASLLVLLFFILRHTHGTPRQQTAFQYDTPTPDQLNALKQGATTSSSHRQNPSFNRNQRPLPDLSSKPLRRRLQYYFPYEPQKKFPAYIWQTWKESPASSSFPDDWRALEASWTVAHPGFVHEVITDDAALHVLQHLYSGLPDVLDAYHTLSRPVLKADFFRYLILLARGGIYSDIDTGVLKPATVWVPDNVPRSSYGLVIGIEADPDRDDWEKWYSRRIQFCQWTIQAKPGHPVLVEIVAKITEETLKRKREGTLSTENDVRNVVELTGPAIWTDTIFEFFNNPIYYDTTRSSGNITYREFTGMETSKRVGDVIVLPITSFSPGVEQMGSKDVEDPMAFVQHLFIGSWKPENERHIGEEMNGDISKFLHF